MHFNDAVTAGHGVLDVVGLSAELIDGLYELAVSRPMYTELYAAWVDMKALVNFRSDRELSGSVMIRSASGTGVIILAHGDLAGAYTSESREISDKPDHALALCDDPNAMIEVKSADTSKHPPLDVDEVVGAQKRQAQQAASFAPAPPAAEPVAPTNPTIPTMPVVPAMPQEPPTAQIPTQSFSTYNQPTPPQVAVAPTTPP